MLDVGDALLICGKGHETAGVIGNDTFPFDDAEQVISVEAWMELYDAVVSGVS